MLKFLRAKVNSTVKGLVKCHS